MVECPLVSVVIAVFNRERYLGEAIRSVLDQTYRPVETIVVDDGSTDGSAALARTFPGVRVLEQANAGPGAARNRGVAASSGELLAFLDSDDVMPLDRLELQARHQREHPETAGVLGEQELFGADVSDVPPALRGRQPLSIMVRRSTFERVGPFGTGFCEDLDWLCRAWGSGARIDSIDAVVVRRRVHNSNMTHDVAAARLAMFRALRDQAARSRAARSI
jgi:glycosyltransferase involved in cell wall biosynthesis